MRVVLSSLEKSMNLSVAICYCKAKAKADVGGASVARMLQLQEQARLVRLDLT